MRTQRPQAGRRQEPLRPHTSIVTDPIVDVLSARLLRFGGMWSGSAALAVGNASDWAASDTRAPPVAAPGGSGWPSELVLAAALDPARPFGDDGDVDPLGRDRRKLAAPVAHTAKYYRASSARCRRASEK
jgi:hypothetical protein